MQMIKCTRTLASVALCGFVILGCGGDSNAPLVATRVAFNTQPSPTVTSGQSLGNVSVTILTADGQIAAGTRYGVTVELWQNGNVFDLLAGSKTVETTTGVANFPNLIVTQAGLDYSLRASIVAMPVFADVMSQPFTVVPGPASLLRFGGLGLVGVGLEVPAVVRITDAGGNTVPDATNAVTVGYTRTGEFGITVAPDDSFGPVTATAVNGVATFHGLTFHKSGTYTLSAIASGLSGTTSTNVNILGMSATRLIFIAQPPNGSASTILAPFTVQHVDDYGNGLGLPFGPQGQAFNVTLSLGSNPTGATLGGTLSVFNVGSAYTFTNITIDKPGTYTLVATSGTRTVTSAPFTIQ
jgi:hypothetical protein